jgi:hypothetical protein
MRVVLRIAAFVLTGVLLSLPALSAEDKDKKADPKKAKDANTEKMVKAGVVTGKVMEVIEAKKSIRIQVTLQVPKLNLYALQSIQHAQSQLAQANSPQAMINARYALAQAQAGLYTIENVQKVYELQVTDEVKVRMNNPPARFDYKGRIKRYTQKELKELKGNDKRPGFPAEFSNLKQDQIVQVTLMRMNNPLAQFDDKSRIKWYTQKDFLPQMSTIMIVSEPEGL